MQLEELYAAAHHQGLPAIAVVTGEAGVGKTRLLQEFLRSKAADTIVVASQARDRDADRPFALIREFAEDHLPRTGELPAALDRWSHPLGHLLEPLVTVHGHPTDGHAHTEEELARAGVALLQHIVGGGPAVAVFEDLHWADAESLEVIERLVRSDVGVLLVLTFRPAHLDRGHAVVELLEQLERQRPVTSIPLQPLSRLELAEFLEAAADEPVPAPVVDRLHERSHGNPFFVEELLATAEEKGGARHSRSLVERLVDAPLPWTTREAVLRRLEALDSETRSLLNVAAVLGDHFETELLREIVDFGDEQVLGSLRQLVEAGLLEEHPPDAFVFRHALTWEAVSQELLEPERRAIHERALEALDAREVTSAVALARHANLAGRPATAARYARQAAAQALHQGAPRSTLRLTELALEHHPDALDVHALAAQAASQLGHLQRAATHAERWMALAEAHEDLEGQAAAGCQLAWLLLWAGDAPAARQALDVARAAADKLEPSAVQAEVMATHARFFVTEHRFAEGVDAADQAISVAIRVNAPRARAKAMLVKATSINDSPQHQDEESLEEAARLLDDAATLATAVGDIETLAIAMHNRLLPDTALDLPPQQLWQWLDEALDVADRYGLERLAASMAVLETHLALMDGQLAAAERALAHARRVPLPPWDAAWHDSHEAVVALQVGDFDGALRAYQRQIELSPGGFMPQVQMDAAYVGALIASHQSDPEGAEAALASAAAVVPQVCPCAASLWWELVVLAIDATATPENVRAWLDRAAPSPLPRHTGLVEYAHGVLLAAEGDTTAAVGALRRSLAADRRGRYAPLLADTHARLAELLAVHGERVDAAWHVQQSLELLEHWPGIQRDAVEALSRRVGTGESSSHELFTPRELEVVKLVVRGYSNSQIADQLFISRKTAATHVSNVLTKTGFESRTQVAAWAVHEQIVDHPE